MCGISAPFGLSHAVWRIGTPLPDRRRKRTEGYKPHASELATQQRHLRSFLADTDSTFATMTIKADAVIAKGGNGIISPQGVGPGVPSPAQEARNRRTSANISSR